MGFNALVPQWVEDVPNAASLAIRIHTGTADGRWSDWYEVEDNDDRMVPEDTDIVGQMITVPVLDVTHQKFQYA